MGYFLEPGGLPVDEVQPRPRSTYRCTTSLGTYIYVEYQRTVDGFLIEFTDQLLDDEAVDWALLGDALRGMRRDAERGALYVPETGKRAGW